MKKLSWSYIIAGVMMVHSLSGAILTIIKNPYGANLDQCFIEFMAGAGIFRARKATERLENGNL